MAGPGDAELPAVPAAATTAATAGPTGPGHIQVAGTLWDLDASPATLEAAAGDARARAFRAGSAQTVVDQSAAQLVGNEDWTGASADVYQRHRRKLTGDLGETEGRLRSVADALDYLASALSSGQSMLDDEWAKLAAVPRTAVRGNLSFDPVDEKQATLVRSAVDAATDIRARVDDAFAVTEPVFKTADRDLARIQKAWQPRSLRVLDLNIGQGFGNVPWPDSDREDGTDRGDIDDIGQVIAGSDANVVTLQEVFRGDLGRLETWLEANTGEEWDVHFAAAGSKVQWDGGGPQPFGNAVLVRHGEGITGSEELKETTLEKPGFLGAGREGRSLEGARIHLDER